MNKNISEKKTWVTPTIEEAPVQMTESGIFAKQVEFFIFTNDSNKNDSRAGS